MIAKQILAAGHDILISYYSRRKQEENEKSLSKALQQLPQFFSST